MTALAGVADVMVGESVSVVGESLSVLIVVILAVVWAAGALRHRLRHKASGNWVAVRGTIEKEENIGIPTSDPEGTAAHVVRISYSYVYEGERYGSSCALDFADKGSADKFLACVPRGTLIVVRCEPHRPHNSFVRLEDNGAFNVLGVSIEQLRTNLG